MLKDKKKILIIQTAFLGDVILSLPLLQNIKLLYPEYLIDFLCIPYTSEILKDNQYINEIIIFDKHKTGKIDGIFKLSKILKFKKYDIAFIPHRSLRSGLIALLAGIPERIGFEKLFFNWLYSKTVKYNSHIHEVERNLSLFTDLEIKNYSITPKIITELEKIQYSEDISRKLSKFPTDTKRIVIAPGSIWETKRWLPDYFKTLCELLLKEKYFIIFIGGKNDKEIINGIRNNLKGTIDLSGKLDIKQTANLLKKCDILISNDSAAVHIASSVNLKVIDIYGPTIPDFGFYPLSNNSICLEEKKLNCRPCGIHGARKCPAGSFDCMKNIKPEQVLEKVKHLLND